MMMMIKVLCCTYTTVMAMAKFIRKYIVDNSDCGCKSITDISIEIIMLYVFVYGNSDFILTQNSLIHICGRTSLTKHVFLLISLMICIKITSGQLHLIVSISIRFRALSLSFMKCRQNF